MTLKDPPISLRLFLGLYAGIIACLSSLLGGEITNLQHGFSADGYQLYDLTILLSCLTLGFLLITLLFKKAGTEVKLRTRTVTAIKGMLILLITIPFLFSLFLIFYYIYLRLGPSPAAFALQLGPSGGGIDLASFLSGFLLGSTLLPRFVFTDTYAPKQVILGSMLAGTFALILYTFISAIEERLSIFQMEGILEFPGLHFKFFIEAFLYRLLNFIISIYSLSIFVILPLWGLFGWFAHRWFYQRQHHFSSQDLAVFE
ncbi:hypothetical protein [Kiloniella sp.]|uniref:hypothetical protein n=1 Tax=Kiloniella sp. TaxID=1938587 RepID=UPI003B010BE8